MGRRGPAPTPTKELELRGSWRAKERKGYEPIPGDAPITKPPMLSAKAEWVWELIVPRLEAMGVLTEVDDIHCAMYCNAVQNYKDCQDFIDKAGAVMPIKDKEGAVIGLKQVPQSRMMVALMTQITRLGGKMGLSPSDRASIALERIEDDQPEDDSIPFFGGGAVMLAKKKADKAASNDD